MEKAPGVRRNYIQEGDVLAGKETRGWTSVQSWKERSKGKRLLNPLMPKFLLSTAAPIKTLPNFTELVFTELKRGKERGGN